MSTRPLTATRPSVIQCSASRREQRRRAPSPWRRARPRRRFRGAAGAAARCLAGGLSGAFAFALGAWRGGPVQARPVTRLVRARFVHARLVRARFAHARFLRARFVEAGLCWPCVLACGGVRLGVFLAGRRKGRSPPGEPARVFRFFSVMGSDGRRQARFEARSLKRCK